MAGMAGHEVAITRGARVPRQRPGPWAPLFVSFKMRGSALALMGRTVESAAVARLLKRWADAAANPSTRISGHSLRPDAAHELVANGADLLAPAATPMRRSAS